MALLKRKKRQTCHDPKARQCWPSEVGVWTLIYSQNKNKKKINKK